MLFAKTATCRIKQQHEYEKRRGMKRKSIDKQLHRGGDEQPE
jgi:hypothetical protein